MDQILLNIFEPMSYHGPELSIKHRRAIRLLKLYLQDGKLHGRLRLANIDDRPVYKAVSYTWGPAMQMVRPRSMEGMGSEEQVPCSGRCIICNDCFLNVTENLYDCLVQLSETFPLSTTEFWIDAICVNQKDLDERGQHVSLMCDVYRQAEEVIIWLGVSDDSTRLAQDMIKELGSVWLLERPVLSAGSSTAVTGNSLLDILKTDPSAAQVTLDSPLGSFHSRAYWRSVMEFFTRTWFTRTWVVQEIVLAAKTIILCGEFDFRWEHIAASSDFLVTRVPLSLLRSWLGEDYDISNAALKAPAKIEAIKRDYRDRHPSTLLRSLIRCRDNKCTEDKDKLFGMLGIFQHVTDTRLVQGDELYPDYSLDTADVYRKVAVHILRQEIDLALLHVAEGEDFRHNSKLPGLPSWAPDWSFGVRKTSIGLGITGYARYNAAANLPCSVAFSEDNATLFLRAARIDSIFRVGESKDSVESGGDFDRWLDIFESATDRFPTAEARLNAFWRSLTTDTEETGRCPSPDVFQAGFLEWITALCAAKSPEVQRRVEKNFPMQTAGPREIRDSLASRFELQYCHSLHERPFVTSTGYLGVGCQSMRAEDCDTRAREYSVWLVCGSRVPLIFQKAETDGRFSLVGGAYIHGLMHGEALQLDLKFETIGVD